MLVASLVLPLDVRAESPRAAKETDEQTAEAKAAFDDGSRFFDLGDYDHAIQSFEKAYLLSGAPALLLNLAQAYRLKGDCAQAAKFYQRFLDKRPTTSRRAEIEARRAEMQACDAKKQPPPPSDVTPPAPAPTPAPAPAPPPARAEEPPANPWRIVAWSGVGLGAAGLVATGVAFGLALAKSSDLADACRADGGCPSSERDAIDSYERLRFLGIVSSVVTVVGVGVAVLGFAKAPSSRAGASAIELVVGAGQIGARGAF